MTYDLGLQLAGIPLSTSVPFVIALGILLSIIGSWLVNSVFTPFELEPNNSVGGAKFGFLGEVYAVTLGLAMIGAFDHFTTAQTNAQREAATLSSLSWAADTYDQPGQEVDRAAMRRAACRWRMTIPSCCQTGPETGGSIPLKTSSPTRASALFSLSPMWGRRCAFWARQRY